MAVIHCLNCHHGSQECKWPIPYEDPKKESITCFVHANNPIGQKAFDVTKVKLLEFPFKDILMYVNLTISDAANNLLIPEEKHNHVKKSVEKLCIKATLTKEDYQDRVTISLIKHSTPRVCWQWRWKGGCSRTSRASNQGPREDCRGRPENKMQLWWFLSHVCPLFRTEM